MRTTLRVARRSVPASGTSLVVAAAWLLAANPVHAAGNPLVEAAREGDLAAVRALIDDGADVNGPASDGSTALLWAAYRSHPEMIAALLEAGADVDAANGYGVTPLLQASRTGDVPVIEALLAGGADPELAHPEGFTPLMASALTGEAEAVRMLLERGADPNVADSFQEQTALMWAAAEGHADVVALLLEAGADPDRQARVSSLTERRNADFPTGGFSALMWAARNGHEDVVTRLAEAGADLNLTNGDGATATMIAVVNDRFDLAARLVELGAGLDDGSLYYAVQMRDATTDWYARDGSRLRPDHDNAHTALDLIERLLESGADPNRPFVGQMHSYSMCCDDHANATPFYRAAAAADVAALELLIEHGADVGWMPERVEGGGFRANGNVGKSALMAAMEGGDGVPLSAGPGYSREGPPPFREPGNRNPADAVAVLLAAGADPDELNEDGEAPLHVAVRQRKVEIIRALAAGGATLDLENGDGLTPLYIAANPLPEEERSPFGPRADLGDASPEEVADLVRELMRAAGIEVEATVASSETDTL